MCPLLHVSTPECSLLSVGPPAPSSAKGTPGSPSMHRLASGLPRQGPPHWVSLYLAPVRRGSPGLRGPGHPTLPRGRWPGSSPSWAPTSLTCSLLKRGPLSGRLVLLSAGCLWLRRLTFPLRPWSTRSCKLRLRLPPSPVTST